MKTPFLLLLVVGVFLSCHGTDARATRRKRNVLELDAVISCVTGMSAIQVWLKLDGYGCYCGFGGEGTPLDDVDECCQRHDNCYDEAQTNGNCPDNAIYTTTYQYKKLCKSEDRDGEITCKLEDTYKNPEVGRCAQELCGCDVELGLCLREKELNSAYEKYNKESCHVK